MDTDKVKIYGAKVKVDSMTKVAEIEAAELSKMMAKCDKIVKHGCNVFINRQLIYNKPEQYFADKGIMSIEHADFEGVERLSKVLGGDIVSTFDHPELVKLGECKLIEEIMVRPAALPRHLHPPPRPPPSPAIPANVPKTASPSCRRPPALPTPPAPPHGADAALHRWERIA